jgi:hypothetical protein
MFKLTKEKEESLIKLLYERFPMLRNLEIKVKDDKVYLWSPLPISESNMTTEDIEAVENLLDADFAGMVSENGLYATIYQSRN